MARWWGPGHHAVPPDQINQRLEQSAGLGLSVVRLKCGDPGIFGCGGEEAAALTLAGWQNRGERHDQGPQGCSFSHRCGLCAPLPLTKPAFYRLALGNASRRLGSASE